jgi:hypothetical protein
MICHVAQQPPGRLGHGASARTARGHRTAGGIQPGDEERGIRRGQLTWKEGEVPGKVKSTGTHRGGSVTMGRRGRLRMAAYRCRVALAIGGGLEGGGVVLQQGAVAREATGTKKSGGDGRWYPFKGCGGEAERGGVWGSQPTRGGARGGGRACPHIGGWHRVADERGSDGSRREWGTEARGARGPAGDRNGVGRARMNSDDF